MFVALDRFEERMAAGMIRARESVVALEYTSAVGPAGSRRIATGVVINSRGDILSVRIDQPSKPAASTHDVAQDEPLIVARDAMGRRYVANWLAMDPETGLTLLRIAPRSVRPIQIADSQPRLGSQVFVVGNPLGLGHSVSRGHIAGIDRALKLGLHQLGGLIQVQAPLYPGDSGAAVANLRGQLLGLIRSGLAVPSSTNDRSEHDNDFGFAIGARDILWVADQLRSRGHVDRAYLGVRLEPVTNEAPYPQSARDVQADSPPGPFADGALLLEVLTGTPAALAGLLPGDRVIALDGELIHSSNDLTDLLDRLPSQTRVHLEVVRGRGVDIQRLTITLRTISRPDILVNNIDSSTLRTSNQTGKQTATPAPLSLSQSVSPNITPLPQPQYSHVTITPRPESGVSPPGLAASPVAGPFAKPTDPRSASAPPAHVTQALSIPPPVRSPLRAPVLTPRVAELELSIPRSISDRFEQLERRLEKVEHQLVSPPSTRQASARPSP